MNVPTPPMTNDFTTLVYSTSDGAVNYTLGSVRPSAKKPGAYNIDLSFETVGDNLAQSLTSSSVKYSDSQLSVEPLDLNRTKQEKNGHLSVNNTNPDFYVQINDEEGESAGVKGSELKGANISDFVVKDGNGYKRAEGSFIDNETYYPIVTLEDWNNASDYYQLGCVGVTEDTESVSNPYVVNAADLTSYYIEMESGNIVQLDMNSPYVTKNDNGTYTINPDLIPAGSKLYKQSEGGTSTINNPNPGQLMIGNYAAYSWDEILSSPYYENKNINWDNYEKAIKNAFGDDAQLEDFYYVITPSKTGAIDVTLYKREDIPSASSVTGLNDVRGYNYSSGTYTDSINYDPVDIKFDSTGRITTITIPTDYKDGEPVAWKELEVGAKSVTDEKAYADAMAKYEHQKYIYDQDQTAINAQMSIIQQEDKKLELKLQRLDNERTQITTEIEALEKVINDNIEASYKTFSG